MKKILVAMSGGVDSSSAAYLLKKEGFEVGGAFMHVWRPHRGERTSLKHEADNARRVADYLGIPFYSFDFRDTFKECVVDYFRKEYEAGRTPNPCAVCNQKIKFGLLLKRAFELGMDGLATGHYVTNVYDEEHDVFLLKEGRDKRKDQSYFLFLLSQDELAHSLFPLSSYRKDDIKGIAAEAGLPIYQKGESQEICFIPDNDYTQFLTGICGMHYKEGVIRDTHGHILGRHNGYFNYTIGQRRGLGIGAEHPLYVVAIDRDTNEVIVGTREESLRQDFHVRDVNWIARPPIKESFKASVRVRYNQNKVDARVTVINNSYTVALTTERDVITPGQAAVFYEGETVLGGGWIE